jgi:NitT/TauT family transport system substrate-binding protein
VKLPVSRARAIALGSALSAGLYAPARAQTLTTVRYGSAPAGETYYLPHFAAEQGFFARVGLKIEFTNFAGASPIISAVLANALDVGQCDALGAANAFNRGFPIAYFGGGGVYDGNNASTLLCTLPDSPIRTARDLEGQAISLPVLASVSGLALNAWLVSNGAAASKVKFYELTYSSMVQAMQRGDIAAALISEPVLAQARAAKSIRILAQPFDAIARSFLISGTFATRAWISANLDVARKIAGALNEAVPWANTHHAESAVIVSKGTGIPLETVKTMTRARFGQLDPRLVQPVLDTALKLKQIQKRVDVANIMVQV